MAPFKQKFWLKCAPSIFLDLKQINLIYALLSRLRAFWVALLETGGTINLLMDRVYPSVPTIYTWASYQQTWLLRVDLDYKCMQKRKRCVRTEGVACVCTLYNTKKKGLPVRGWN